MDSSPGYICCLTVRNSIQRENRIRDALRSLSCLIPREKSDFRRVYLSMRF